ncbi:MAG: MogA/MoaB family molybdenum cofactor biosynthesis protein [Candidatus Latescibacterota bacterium]|nr:MAG: MogA/MoaB family molybdenum cofactor biosynthesis protein [Candidatus Latescibacterota bacterium]
MRSGNDPVAKRRACAILITSDRAASGVRPDETTPLLRNELEQNGFDVRYEVVVPDDRIAIKNALDEWIGEQIDFVVVSGGSGVAPTDVTPDVTLEIIDRRIPGMEEAMRRVSLEHTPFAMLSRGVVGVARQTLIANVPGSPRGAVENLRVIAPALGHAIELIHGGKPDK